MRSDLRVEIICKLLVDVDIGNDWYSKRVGDPDFLAIVEAIAAEEPVHKDKIRP